jgi:glycosyltransferase involved in cell wall biosynthesis
MTKTRLLIISPARMIGGGETYLLNILPKLQEDFDVTIMGTKVLRSFLPPSTKFKSLRLFPVFLENKLKRVQRLKKLYYRSLFKSFFMTNKYDLVNFQSFEGSMLEALPSPLVVTILTRFLIPRKYDDYVRRVFSRAELVLCVSRQTQKDLVLRKIDPQTCTVVHNGINTSTYYYVPHPGDLITWVGRVEEADKNPLLFVKIAQESQKQELPYRFRMVGDGKYLKELKNYAVAQKITNLEFTGHKTVEEMPRVYKEASLLCMTSMSEGLPLVLLEAMASGIPGVCTKVGGIPEVINNSACGVLVDGFEEKKFVKAIESLLADKRRYQKMRQQARARVEAEFTIDHMAKKTIDSMKEILMVENIK